MEIRLGLRTLEALRGKWSLGHARDNNKINQCEANTVPVGGKHFRIKV